MRTIADLMWTLTKLILMIVFAPILLLIGWEAVPNVDVRHVS